MTESILTPIQIERMQELLAAFKLPTVSAELVQRLSTAGFGGNTSCRTGPGAAGAAGSDRQAPNQAATPRCCNTANPPRHLLSPIC